MKMFLALMAAVLSLSLVTSVQAKEKKAGKGLKGQVVSVADDGKSIVISTGKKADAKQQTVELDAQVSVTVDGAPAADGVKALKSGMYVMVSPAEGKATSITASTTKPEKKAK